MTLSLAAGASGQDESEKKIKSLDNLKSIGIAFYNYHDTFGHLPTSTRDKNGKLLLSWRVEILPYIEGVDLYNQFHLGEPWGAQSSVDRQDAGNLQGTGRRPGRQDGLPGAGRTGSAVPS
ncbi:MAG TPA: DUF1559 domain-containing protein [Pirellulales bacterium]|nr:DUF1559 domain-containing protein [Pirellulales bacterium]